MEQVHRQRVVSLIGHVFQLTYATILDTLIQEEKVNRCNGCAIQHPSQRQHSCLMMDSEDVWFYFRDDAVGKMNLNDVLKVAGSVCNSLGFKLGKSWEAYVNDLAKMPWTSLYLTSWNLKDSSRLLKRSNYKIEFCMLFMMVLTVSSGKISVKESIRRTMTSMKFNVLK